MLSRKADTETDNHCMEYISKACRYVPTAWSISYHMACYFPFVQIILNLINGLSELRKIHFGALYNVQLLFAIVILAKFSASIICAKINFWIPGSTE